MVVEDLHWADAAMVEFLEHLVDRSTWVPLMVICTARPELYERHPGWGRGKRNSTTLLLSPLTESETSQLLEVLLEQAVLPAQTRAALLERAAGNPLYAEEFARMLTDGGIVTGHDGGLSVPPRKPSDLPETIQALIAGRLDTLRAESKALLADGSVLGKVFSSGALAAMSGLDEKQVRQGLHELARKELIRPDRVTSMRDQPQYTFSHALVRDVAYAQIPRAARMAKHRAAAAWIEQTAGDRVADQAEILAHHYEQALELARAARTGEGLTSLQAAAAQFLILAADRVMALDISKADVQYRRALEYLPAGDTQRGHVLARLAEATSQVGEAAEAEAIFREAISELMAQGDAPAAGKAMVDLSRVPDWRGQIAESREMLHEALQVLEEAGATAELALAYGHMAADRAFSGASAEAIEWAERALAIAMEDSEERLHALGRRGMARFGLGDLGGIEDVRAAAEMAVALDLTSQIAIWHNNLGELLWRVEGPAVALEAYRIGIEISERRGFVAEAMTTMASTLGPLFDLGRWNVVLDVADAILPWLQEHGQTYFLAGANIQKARVFLYRGQTTEAASLSKSVLPTARETRDLERLPLLLGTEARIQQLLGRLQEAVDLVEELEDATRDARGMFPGQHLTDEVRVCVAAGERAMAVRLLDELQVAAPRGRYAVLTARAILEEAYGELERALPLYTEATEAWQDFGHVLEHGQALLGAGRCLVGLGRRVEARGRLVEAGDVFARLKAVLLLSETDDLLQRATTRTS